MAKDKLFLHDVISNEIIERDFTAEEQSERNAFIKEIKAAEAAKQAEAEAKEAARQAILDRLGLTADEAKLLLG